MPTTQDPTQVRLAPFGKVYIAPAGTTLPVDVTTTLSSYTEVGLIDDNGVSITPSVSTTDIKAWQSLLPVKTTITEIGIVVKFNMMQTNPQTTAEYFFGSSWVNQAGLARLDISASPTLQQRVLCIEWNDDVSNTARLSFGNGLFTDRDAFVLHRTDASTLGMTYEALASGGLIAQLLSNDPNLVPAT